MSGPKVISVEARRLRLQRECIEKLTALRQAVAEWRETAKRAGTHTPVQEAACTAEVARLEALQGAQQWEALAPLLSARVDFYRQEASNARAVVIEKAASLLRRRRQLPGAAARVLAELRQKGIEAPLGLSEAAGVLGAPEGELARMEAAIQGALALLERHRVEEERSEADSRLAAIARGYAPAAGAMSIADWLATHPGEMPPLLSDRLTRLISEIEGWGGELASRPLLDRMAAIAQELDPGHRALLEDSLVLEVEEIRARQRRLQDVRARLHATLASLAPFTCEEAENWRREIAAALASDDVEKASLMVANAAAWRAEAAAREEADARRKAVLESLALLGYEVREGMAAVWAERGRVVVAKPQDPSHGVELALPPTGEAMQARVVAFRDPGQPETPNLRDREIEEMWCQELAEVRTSLESRGFSASILRAEPPGVVPLRKVERRPSRAEGWIKKNTRLSSSSS